MKLVKYERPMDMLDHFFSNMDRGWFPFAGNLAGDETKENPALRLARTNIEETKDGYVFTLEMPGLSKKDVEVSLEADKLTVKGERTEEKTGKNGDGEKVHRREIRSTRFERSFYLGKDVDPDNIKAKMDNGVLTITLAKRAEKAGRKVDVS